MLIRHGKNQRAAAAHLLVQQPDGVVFEVVGAKAVGADEFGKAIGVVGIGGTDGAHFVQHHFGARLGGLPGGLGTG